MRKQLSVTLACFLLASVSASAQGWKAYEEAAQGKAYEKSDCVTLLDSTLVSVQPTGQGSFAVCKVNAERKSKVDDNTARMQSIKQLGV